MKLATATTNGDLTNGVDITVASDVLKKLDHQGILLDAEAFGRLRRELIWTIGETRAQGLWARFGFSCGQADAMNPLLTYPSLHGIAALQKYTPDPTRGEFTLETVDSCEATEVKRFFPVKAKTSQCWMLAGYLTGFYSGHFNHTIYFLETQCVAKGDERCQFIGKRSRDWSDEAESVLIGLFEEDNMARELADVCDQLSQTKNRYQNLFEYSSVPLLIVDPDTGQYLDANIAAEELTGYTREDLLNMNVFDLRPSTDHQVVIDYLKQLKTTEKVDDHEFTIVRKDGALRSVLISSKLLSFGGRRAIQSAIRDITDLKTSERKEKDLLEQLNRSERLSSIGRLAASVAHELKNPLGAIKNAIYYVRDALTNNPLLESDPHLKEILKLAEGEVDSSVTIIGELLDFSRVVQIVPRRTIVNELLEQLPSIIKIPDNVELQFDLDPTLPSARVDPDRLTQVFCNIANNAIQAMPKGGKLKIISRYEVGSAGKEKPSEELIAVGIEDSGVGIETWHLPKIFEPLFTTKARGTGLGLAISNNIVEKHGGAILVTSQPGKGSCFTVKLPLHPPDEKEESPHAPQ
ncbi:MAG: PAS domain S-box protein [Elusimicrobia bacterium]|nr:PAS domain S-box protein [Candidatus Obscuribacterium magneticum]